jgi:hypothetical protein
MCRNRKLVSAFGAVFLKVGENPLVGQIEFARMLPIPVRYLDKALSQLLLGAHKIDIEFLLHYGLEVSALENIGRRLVGECIRRSVVAASPQL